MFRELGPRQLTHEISTTFLAEAAAIVNARPISTISSDPNDPEPLSPSMLLTMKTCPAVSPPGQFSPPDLYTRRRWRQAQYLADQFRVRWRKEYLQSLQRRNKWTEPTSNLSVDEVVLLKDRDEYASVRVWVFLALITQRKSFLIADIYNIIHCI